MPELDTPTPIFTTRYCEEPDPTSTADFVCTLAPCHPGSHSYGVLPTSAGRRWPANPWSCPGGTAVTRASSTGDDDWLAARDGLIGASELGMLLGLTPQYGDAHTLWARKTGRMPKLPATVAQDRGHALEDAIVAHWLDRYATYPVRIRRQGLMRSRQYPHLGATVDRLSVCRRPGHDASRCVVELKTAAQFEDWEGAEVPTVYQLQGQAQLAATGREHVHYVVMGPRFQIEHRLVERDDELIDNIGQRVEQWWAEYVTADQPPQPTSGDLDAVMRSNFRAEPKKVHVITDDEAPHVHALIDAKSTIVEATAQLDTAKAVLMHAMGDATELRWDDGTLAATWNAGKTVDGVNKDFRAAYPDLIERYSVPVPEHTEVDVAKLTENEPWLFERGVLRRRRTFNAK